MQEKHHLRLADERVSLANMLTRRPKPSVRPPEVRAPSSVSLLKNAAARVCLGAPLEAEGRELLPLFDFVFRVAIDALHKQVRHSLEVFIKLLL